MVREPVIAFITEIGTRTSHTAIMARALEIPAVVGRRPTRSRSSAPATWSSSTVSAARSSSTPTRSRSRRPAGRGARHLAFARGLLSARNQPCVTRDGEPVSLKANVELPAEAILALDHGAEGHRPLSHGVHLHRSHHDADGGRAVRALPRRRRGRCAAARDAAHVRHRRRQVRVELPAAGRDEPRPGPSRGASGALAARRLPHAAARNVACERPRRPSDHGPDGRERAGAPRGAPAARPGDAGGRRWPAILARSTFRSAS